jgi:hypothetical protein
LTLDKAQADMKNAHVTPIVTVDQMMQPVVIGLRAHGHQPNIQQGNHQSQARQAQEMTQHRALQVKAMLFHVVEGFFARFQGIAGIR